MNAFGNFLYSLRKERRMTQQELADRLGVTNKAVSKWETGEAFPETAQLIPIADTFGVTVDELLRGGRNASCGQQESGKFARCPLNEVGTDDVSKPDPAAWRRTRGLILAFATVAVLFCVVYLLSVCFTERIALRDVVLRGSVCMLLMALAAAGSCILGIVLTQKIYAEMQKEKRRALETLRVRSIVGIFTLMLGICCFVFFELYRLPAYFHRSALIAGMTIGGILVVAAVCLIAFGVFGARLGRRR